MAEPVASVTNVFNTYSIAGKGALPYSLLKPHLFINLFLNDELRIPALSLLNCETSWVLKNHHPRLLSGLLSGRTIQPIFSNDTPITFTDLHETLCEEQLNQKGELGIAERRELALYLDEAYRPNTTTRVGLKILM